MWPVGRNPLQSQSDLVPGPASGLFGSQRPLDAVTCCSRSCALTSGYQGLAANLCAVMLTLAYAWPSLASRRAFNRSCKSGQVPAHQYLGPHALTPWPS